MNRNLIGAAIVAATVTLAGCSGHSTFVPSQAAAQATSMTAAPLSRQPVSVLAAMRSLHVVCGAVPIGFSRCYSIATRFPVRVAENGRSPDSCLPPAGSGGSFCYSPHYLQVAYNLITKVAKGGKGQTVALVDAFGYSTAKADLALFRRSFGQAPLCAACFKVVNQSGGKSLPPAEGSSWSSEQALDVDMVSAVCPNCHIVLVQATSNANTNLYAAVQTALRLANVVSISWGGGEYTSSYPTFDHHPGKVITASAGDEGAGAGQPCSFAGVICVGGTSLTPGKSARGWNEVVWDGLSGTHECQGSGGAATPCGTGSGCSAFVQKPAWQHDKGCSMRSEADISAVADPYTGAVFAFENTCCYVSGGTSVSSPLIAGMIGLAGNAKKFTAAKLWAHGSSKKKKKVFNDILKGTNQRAGYTFVCPKTYAYICKAAKGFDGPSGWGTPNGVGAL